MKVRVTELRTGFIFESCDIDEIFNAIIQLNKITNNSYSLVNTAITLDKIFNGNYTSSTFGNLNIRRIVESEGEINV